MPLSPPRLRALQRRPSRVFLALGLALVPSVAAATSSAVPAAVPPASAAASSPMAGADTGFVTRSGSSLTLGGRPFRFAGANLYWTGLDENVGGVDPDGPRSVDYPTFFRIRDGLRTARQLGASVVRAHTVGISTGTPESLEPSYGATNPSAWDTMDYTVAQAGRLGLRLIVPLTDNWSYYHGGRYDFLRWLGLGTDDHGSAFYTDPRAVAAYQSYVRRLLTHVNRFTGLRYADDPTVMAWELGNEMDYATPEWVEANALFVKSLAPSQLVAAGRSWRVDWAVMASPAVDISDSHYYPLDVTAVREDAAAVTGGGKVFMVGEYPSTDATDDALTALAADPNIAGAAVWSLFPHADHYGFVRHDDGYTLHVPGDTPAMQAAVSSIERFGAALASAAGAAPQTTGPDVGLVEPPVVTVVTAPSSPGGRLVRWRGSAGAAAYRVSWTSGRVTSVGPLLPAQVTSWSPPTPSADTTYVVDALDAGGSTLSTSSPVRAPAVGGTVTDLLEDAYVSSGRSVGLVRTPRPTGVALAPAPGATGWVTWRSSDAVTARFVLTGSLAVAPVVEGQTTSGDWVALPTTSVTHDHGSSAVSVALAPSASSGQVRLSWPAGSGFALTRVVLTTGG